MNRLLIIGKNSQFPPVSSTVTILPLDPEEEQAA